MARLVLLQRLRILHLKITGDTLNEGEEQFTITLGGSTLANATLKADETIGTVIITDNDPQPSLTIANEMENEGDDPNNGQITFTPTLSTASGRDVVVTYYTEASGIFPVSDNDYTAVAEADEAMGVTATTITIDAGDITPNPAIRIPTIFDDNSEPDETFTLHYSADFATVLTPTATGTILNDDPRTIAINSVDIAEDGVTAELVVTMSPAAGTNVDVTYTLGGTATGDAADYTHTPAPLTFLAGENKKGISHYD